MRIIDFHCRGGTLTWAAMLTLAACALAACTEHAPTRPVVPIQAAKAPVITERSGWNARRSEAQAAKSQAERRRDSLDPSEAGYYLDVLQGRLLQLLGTDATLSRAKDRIEINFGHHVHFDVSDPWLDAAGCRGIKPLARALVEFRKTVISVKVGADGADHEAEVLAEHRSDAVAECLSRFGITPRRIVIPAIKSDATESASAGVLILDAVLVLRNAG